VPKSQGISRRRGLLTVPGRNNYKPFQPP